MKGFRILLISCFFVFFAFATSYSQQKGAKAIFDSGEGPAVVSPVSKQSGQTKPAPAVQKYVGVSYQIMLLKPDGSFKPVSKARTFRSGERVKLIVRTNRPGYLTIINVGPTGNTHVLFNDYVDAFTFHEIPKNTNFVFAGTPGTEKLLIMLSAQPNPMVAPHSSGQTTTVQTPSSSPSTQMEGAPSVGQGTTVQTPPSAPMGDLLASLESAKGMKGAKDIVVEDEMRSKFTVISSKTGYRPVENGAKDILLETSGGLNYGVVPVSVIEGDGILTLQINLRHK